MKKKFECEKGKCENYVAMVLLDCKKCIKHISIPLSKEQIEAITRIIANPSN